MATVAATSERVAGSRHERRRSRGSGFAPRRQLHVHAVASASRARLCRLAAARRCRREVEPRLTLPAPMSCRTADLVEHGSRALGLRWIHDLALERLDSLLLAPTVKAKQPIVVGCRNRQASATFTVARRPQRSAAVGPPRRARERRLPAPSRSKHCRSRRRSSGRRCSRRQTGRPRGHRRCGCASAARQAAGTAASRQKCSAVAHIREPGVAGAPAGLEAAPRDWQSWCFVP